MITIKRIREYLKALLAKTASRVKDSQAGLVPVYLNYNMNENHAITGHHTQLSVLSVDQFRYNSRWYNYKFSVDKPNETFGILKVDNVFTTQAIDELSRKGFIGTINRLVHQGYIRPFMLMIDGKMVPWDAMEFVYDCGDTWLILRGVKYNHYNLSIAKTATVILYPFRMEYFGSEDDLTFNLRYAALQDYLQSTCSVRDGKLYLMSPTLETEHEYNSMMFNVGGWAYEQMKLYHFGMLSDDRIDKLRKIQVNKFTYDEYGYIIDHSEVKFNLLDTDVPTDTDLHGYIYGISKSEYDERYIKLHYTEDGLYNPEGPLTYYATDESIRFREVSTNDHYIWDLSDIQALLFRENFMIFVDGKYVNKFDLITSVNNMTLIPNPSKLNVTAVLLYNDSIAKIITNSNNFKKDYINEQARLYLEAILHSADPSNLPNANPEETSGPKLVDAYVPNIEEPEQIFKSIDVSEDDQEIESEEGKMDPKLVGTAILLNESGKPKTTGASSLSDLSAQEEVTNRMIRNVEAYMMSESTAPMPSLTDYVVYISRTTASEGEALDIIGKLLKNLEFAYSDATIMAEKLDDSIESVIDYDVSLLNGLYHTGVDSFSMMGAEANKALIHQFMYESRRGIKIPRKLYKHHETYFMIYVNGELFSEYYRTIAYANFFFIPVADDFQFNDNDIIEVCYFKNVNNNECRFYLSDWLLDQWETNATDARFYNVDLFDPYFKPTELKIFAHYPRDMLMYPSLIPEESEDIAFNVSYRDDNEQLCIKKAALTHIVSEDTREYIESITGEPAPSGIADALDTMDVDAYMNSIRNNTYIVEKGINIFSQDRCVLRNALVAVSSRKFVYQRLFVEQRSYRIKLDKRFRYCDNPKHYLLFINGRRQRQDSFLVTIPKHTRPFNGLYLYTAVFVGPQDRVELFYLPYDMTDMNFDETRRYELQPNGYLEIPRSLLNAPLSKDLYMLFINGKKIPASEIIDVDSHTIRVAIDTNTLHYPMVTAVNLDSLDNVVEYLHDEDRDSTYDALIKYVKSRANGYNLLDKMFGSYIQMSDNESDKLWMNVAKIAILNEVIRDFWVTSGYNYNNQEIVYDYDIDDYFEQLEDGTLILPALNAEPDINIYKNDISLLYFYTDPASLMCEYGDTIDEITFFWEYSQRMNQPWGIISQKFNGVEIGPDARTWTTTPDPGVDHYRFVANTGQQYIIKDIDVGHVNGTYWGLVDADALKYYEMLNLYQNMDQIVAVVPNDKTKWPSVLQQELESGNEAYKEYIADNYTIIYGLGYGDEPEREIDIWADPRLVNLYGENYIAICFDGRIFKNLKEHRYELPDEIDADLILQHINAMIGFDVYARDIDFVDGVADLPPEAEYMDADYNIMNETFIAIAQDTGDKYHTEFVLVRDISMPIPEGEDEWEVDAQHSSELIAIQLDDDAIVRHLTYGEPEPAPKTEPDYIDFNIGHESFIAIAQTQRVMTLADLTIDDADAPNRTRGRSLRSTDDSVMISDVRLQLLDEHNSPRDGYLMIDGEPVIYRNITTARRLWTMPDRENTESLLNIMGRGIDGELVSNMTYNVEANVVIEPDELYIDFNMKHPSFIAIATTQRIASLEDLNADDLDTPEDESYTGVMGSDDDAMLSGITLQLIDDDESSDQYLMIDDETIIYRDIDTARRVWTLPDRENVESIINMSGYGTNGEFVSNVTYNVETQVAEEVIDPDPVYNIGVNSFIAIDTDFHSVDDLYAMPLNDEMTLYYKDGIVYTNLEDPTETDIGDLKWEEVDFIQKAILNYIDIVDLDTGEDLGQLDITGSETDDSSDSEGPINEIEIEGIDRFVSHTVHVFRNLMADPNFVMKAKPLVEKLVSLRNMMAKSSDDVISDISYTTTVRKAIQDYEYDDEFDNHIMAFHGDFDMVDIETNDYIEDPSYYFIKDDVTYHESDFSDYYEIELNEDLRVKAELDRLLNNNGILLDSVVIRNNNYTMDEFSGGLFYIDPEMYCIDYDEFVAVYGYSTSGIDAIDINTGDDYSNAIYSEDLESGDIYDSMLIDGVSGEDYIPFDGSDASLEMYHYLDIVDTELDPNSIRYITFNGFIAMDGDNIVADPVTYITTIDSDDLYDPTDGYMYAIGNGATYNNMHIEPMTEQFTIEGIPGFNINTDGFVVVDEDGNPITNELDILTGPYTITVSGGFDPTHEGFMAILTDSGRTVNGLAVEPMLEPEEIIDGPTGFNIYIDGFVALDGNDQLITSDIEMLPEPYVITVSGGFDPTYEGFMAIPVNGGESMSGLDVEPMLEPEEIADGPTGVKVFEDGTDNSLLNAQPDGSSDMIEQVEAWEDPIESDEFYDVENSTTAVAIGTGERFDEIKYIFDPVVPNSQDRWSLFNFYNIETLGMPDAHYDSTVTPGDEIMQIDDGIDPVEQILDFNEYLGHKVIYPEEGDRISADYLWAYPNRFSNVIDIHEFNINAPKVGIVTPGTIDDNAPVSYTEYPDMSYTSKYGIQDVGIYDIEKHSAGLFDAIEDGTAQVICGATYQVDGYADDNQVITYEMDDELFAQDLSDNNQIHNIAVDVSELSYNPGTVNFGPDSGIIAMLGEGETIDKLIFVYDENHPDMKYYFNEGDLPDLIAYLDKYLIPEPANVQLNGYQMGNFKYFVFACPKRLVYNTYHMMTKWTLPDITSPEFLAHCIDNSSMPIYTDGTKAAAGEGNVANTGNDTSALYKLIEKMKMEFIGECMFTNDYGYREPYMVWKTNGFFTRLQDGYGIDIGIKIGITNNKVVTFYNTMRDYEYDMQHTADDAWNADYFKPDDFDSNNKPTFDPYVGPYVSNVKHREDLHREAIFQIESA